VILRSPFSDDTFTVGSASHLRGPVTDLTDLFLKDGFAAQFECPPDGVIDE
jgi:hypothetical protein